MPSRILAVLPFMALLACADPASEPLAETRAPIIGGVRDDAHAYVVGVGVPYETHGALTIGGPFCSGTVVSRRTVLTAGHCVSPEAGARGGVTAIFFGPDVAPPLRPDVTVVGTVRAVRHPGFDPATLANDLAMIELDADAPTQAAPLLRETMTRGPSFIGPPFTFVGYGNDGEERYGIRRSASFPIDALGPAQVGLDTGAGPIDGSRFYYRTPDANTCDGDSGGPAFVVRDGVERIAGVTSSGDAACEVDGTDGRADEPAVEAFIQPVIDAFEGDDPCRADGVCNGACDTGGRLVDPDCAPLHCAADGICALACADPPDPDCAPGATADGDAAAGTGGCSAAGGGAGGAWAMVALVLAGRWLLRRR